MRARELQAELGHQFLSQASVRLPRGATGGCMTVWTVENLTWSTSWAIGLCSTSHLVGRSTMLPLLRLTLFPTLRQRLLPHLPHLMQLASQASHSLLSCGLYTPRVVEQVRFTTLWDAIAASCTAWSPHRHEYFCGIPRLMLTAQEWRGGEGVRSRLPRLAALVP